MIVRQQSLALIVVKLVLQIKLTLDVVLEFVIVDHFVIHRAQSSLVEKF